MLRHKSSILKLAIFWVTLEVTCFLAAQTYFALGFSVIKDRCENNTYTCRTVIQPHPYAGYSRLDSGHASDFGPEGFNFIKKLPLQREEGVRYIGVFGGSVADNFCSYFQTEAPELRNYFASHYRVAAQKIQFKCLSNTGYKQPQQMVLATLYARELDFVLNIEGYNEITNQVIPGYPNHFPDPNLAAYIYFSKDTAIPEQVIGALLVKPYEWSMRPAAIPLPSIRFTQILVNQLAWYWATTFNREAQNGSTEVEAETIARRNRTDWVRYARLNMTYLKSLNRDFLLVAQPYLPLKTSKSPAELAIVEQRRAYLTAAQLAAYTSAIHELSTSEYKRYLFDSTGVFEGVQDGVFQDFCHFKEDGRGREIFTSKLIDRLRLYFASAKK